MFIRKYWIPLSVLLIAIAAVSVYWTQTRPPKEPIVIYKPLEPLPKSERQTQAPVVSEVPQGHVHADGDPFHAEPHEPIAEPAEVPVSEPKAEPPPRPKYDKGAGNPSPYQSVPVDLWDFEATKAAMIENINFVKANWDPKVFDPDVDMADAITFNIASAARARQLGLFTREQALELMALQDNLLAFKGIDGSRAHELYREGHTLEEAYRISLEETLQRQGLK